MIYQVKSGKKELSEKALYRLEQAERAAGLAPPLVEQVQSAKTQGSMAVKQVLRGTTAEEILGAYSPSDQLKFVQAVQEYMAVFLNQFIVDSAYLAETVSSFLKSPADKRLMGDMETLAFQVKESAEFLKKIRDLGSD